MNTAIPHGGENLEVMREATNYNEWLRSLVRKFGDGADTAVDFGAGLGTFSDALGDERQGLRCVEPEAASRAVLESRGFDTCADLSEIPDASVAYAYTLNVLEHIDDDVGTLRELERILEPGGRLFVYVPAFELLFTSMDRHVGHHRRYRIGQLESRIESAGFVVQKSAYADVLGFFATLALKLFDKPEPAPLSPGLVRFYDRFLFPLSRLMSVPCAKLLGKNVYVVALKPEASRP